MLRRLVGFKASLPALSSSGGRRGVSEVASNFPFANGREGPKTRSSSDKMHNTRPWKKLHIAMSSTNQSASPRHEVEVAENLKPSPPNSNGDEDAFAELGPSISESDELGFGLTRQMHKNCHTIESEGPPRMLSVHGSQKSTITSQRYDMKMPHMRTSLNQESSHPADTVEKCTSSSSMIVDKVPSNISLQDLREAVPMYGAILSASVRTRQDYLALAAEQIIRDVPSPKIRDVQSPKIRDVQSPENVAVRITNIGIETTEPAIHSMCMSCGHVSGLARTNEGAVDVTFSVKDSSTAQTIVKRLNDVCLDDCQWSAKLLPEFGQNSRSKVSSSQWLAGLQISNLIGTSQKQLRMQQIYLEDLQELHHAILHLRDKPVDMNS